MFVWPLASGRLRLIKRWVERAIKPVPGEMMIRRGVEGSSSESLGQTAHPATEQGTQGLFGRLAGRRPSALPLWPSIELGKVGAVPWITGFYLFSWRGCVASHDKRGILVGATGAVHLGAERRGLFCLLEPL